MKIEKAKELRDLLDEFDRLSLATGILSNYDSKVEIKISSVYNRNNTTPISICLPLNSDDRNKIVSGIASALEEVRTKIDDF